jgi:hypothetical protein
MNNWKKSIIIVVYFFRIIVAVYFIHGYLLSLLVSWKIWHHIAGKLLSNEWERMWLRHNFIYCSLIFLEGKENEKNLNHDRQCLSGVLMYVMIIFSCLSMLWYQFLVSLCAVHLFLHLHIGLHCPPSIIELFLCHLYDIHHAYNSPFYNVKVLAQSI